MLEPLLSIFTWTEIVLTTLLTIFTVAGGFLVTSYYFGLDHQTNQFDDSVRTQIKSQPALNGLERTADTKLIATSNERSSKAISKIQE